MKKILLIGTTVVMAALLSACCFQHEWAEATCGTPRTCQVCGKTKGEPTGEHVWIEANCDTSKHCSVCGKYEGSPLGHTWKDATCTEARTCTRCGFADGEPLGHQYDRDDFVCARCGEETVFGSSDMREILSQSVNNYSSFCDNYLVLTERCKNTREPLKTLGKSRVTWYNVCKQIRKF